MDQLSNVTLRRQKLIKSKSLESIDSSNSLSSTASENVLARSLDLSTNRYSSFFEEMKIEIGQLKSSLLSTQTEMENIILENVDLKKQISQLKKDLGVLKQICRSPITSGRQNNMSPSTKKALRRRLTDSFQITPLHVKEKSLTLPKEPVTRHEPTGDMDMVSVVQPSAQSSVQPMNGIENREQLPHRNEEVSGKIDKINVVIPTCKTSQNTHNKRVFILGGQQCSGLALKLIKSRLRNPYVKYQFMSFVKPNASTEEILKNVNLCNNITSEDRIVIAVGQHDTNPLKVIAEVCTFFKSVSCPVLILSVRNNIYLNEIKLNDMVDLLSRQYNDCKFIDVNSDQFDYYACKNINAVLDQLDYDKRFLSLKAVSRDIMCGGRVSNSRASRHMYVSGHGSNNVLNNGSVKTQCTQTENVSIDHVLSSAGELAPGVAEKFFRDL